MIADFIRSECDALVASSDFTTVDTYITALVLSAICNLSVDRIDTFSRMMGTAYFVEFKDYGASTTIDDVDIAAWFNYHSL